MGPKPRLRNISDNDAYVRVFDEILREIDHRFFDEQSIKTYESFSLEARYLITRLYCRQLKWVRQVELLNYLSPETLEVVLNELVAKRAVDRGSSIEDLCAVASVKELMIVAQSFGIKPKGAARSSIVSSLVSLMKQKSWFGPPIEPKIRARLQAEIGGGQPVVLSGWLFELLSRFEAMFLVPAGDVAIDVIVRANMGLIRFPDFNYTPQKDAPIFTDREEFEAWFLARQVCFPLEDANRVEIDVIETVRNGIASSAGIVANIYGRAAYKIGQILAKMHNFQMEYEWLDIYVEQTAHRSKLGEVLLRKVLLETRFWSDTKNRMWLLKALNTYYEAEVNASEIERLDLERKATKLWRMLKAANISAPPFLSHSTKTSVHEQEVCADLQTSSDGSRTKWGVNNNTVEETALDHYAAQAWEGMHLENSSIHTVFWLSLCDIVFSQRQQFRCRFQSAPLNIQQAIDESDAKERLGDPHLARRIFDNYERLNESVPPQIIGVNWDIPADALRSIVNGIGGSLHPLLEHLRSNYRLYQSGFPDLTLWNNEKTRFVEVKSTNDTLSDNQRCWLQFLGDIGLEVEICRVRNN